MKPYYEASGITIYHADCRDVLQELPTFDLLLTDPPYGIGKHSQAASTGGHGGRKEHIEESPWDDSRPDAMTFGLMFGKTLNQIIWGGNYFTRDLPPRMGWLVWDKGQRIAQSDGELAFTSENRALRIWDGNRCLLLSDGTVHPTQKPLALMKWCLSLFPEAKTVLDPFMGSGTTLVAAKALGLKATGIEISEKYCAVAVERLRQEVMAFPDAAPENSVTELINRFTLFEDSL